MQPAGVTESRGNCPSFEPSPELVGEFTKVFLGPIEPHLRMIAEMVRKSA